MEECEGGGYAKIVGAEVWCEGLGPWLRLCEEEGLGRKDVLVLMVAEACSLCYDPEGGIEEFRLLLEEALPEIFRSLEEGGDG